MITKESLLKFLEEQENQEKDLSIIKGLEIYYNKIKLYNRNGTLNQTKANIKPILTFFKQRGIKTFKEITTSLINDYINIRKNQVKAITLNKEICTIQYMENYLIDQEYLKEKTFKFKRLPQTKTKIPSINKNDIQTAITYLKNNCNIKAQLIFLLILTTGIRTTELCYIENKNINLNNKEILLTFTKSKHNRKIYLVDEVIKLIKLLYNPNHQYLFQENENNIPLTANAVRKTFKRIKDKSNIEILSPHKLRHFFATNIYNKSKNLNLVKELLGHQSIEMTKIYLDIDDKELQLSNNLFNPINDYSF